jgi:hypothetical protein
LSDRHRGRLIAQRAVRNDEADGSTKREQQTSHESEGRPGHDATVPKAFGATMARRATRPTIVRAP